MDINEQIKYLTTGNIEILPGGKEALVSKLKLNRPLRVKLGIDPTSPDLHLGHTVCLQLLRRFQDLGHTPVLIIGGFTAQLGDPTGRNEARPPLTPEQVEINSQTYLDQVRKILDMSRAEIVNNNDWFKNFALDKVLKLFSTVTVNQLIAKEAFGERLDKGFPLYMHEIVYPILQGYDSVQIKADIEIGGQDQRFNVLAGRDLQKYHSQDAQIVMLAPLLVGLDGKKKMSKSVGNYIGISEDPKDIYGKTMSLPDALLLDWYSLVLSLSSNEFESIKKRLDEGENPRDLKMQLAREIIKLYYSEEAAQSAEQDFISKFQKREIPTEMSEFSDFDDETSLAQILFATNMTSSVSEAKRKIKEGAVKIDGEKVISLELKGIELKDDCVIQLGKRNFIKIKRNK